MRKIFFLTILLLIPSQAFALFGAGDIVSDPGSYSYYVEQIKIATEEFENMQKQLETAQNTLEETQKMRGLLEGTYSHATQTIADLRDFQKKLKSEPSALLNYAQKFLKTEIHGSEGEWIDAEDLIRGVFIDPRKKGNGKSIPDDVAEIMKQANDRFHLRQKTLEQTILKAEDLHKRMPEKYQKIEEAAAKINITASVKEAMDLNNQLLAEIWRAITDLTSLTGYIGEAQAMLYYQGVNNNTSVQMTENIENDNALIKTYRPNDEYLDRNNIDTDQTSEKFLLQLIED